MNRKTVVGEESAVTQGFTRRQSLYQEKTGHREKCHSLEKRELQKFINLLFFINQQQPCRDLDIEMWIPVTVSY